jgi:4-amino-4-deoxy-L-arabinose transferase-like glycosyltransferase
MTNRTRTDLLLLAGLCAFLFFYGLAQFGLIGADEPRYAQVAREMWERHDWITPTLGGEPWLEKPPLYYWQAMLAYSIFGVSDWAARLPSAVDATLLILAIYFFLRKFRPGFAVDGALIAASSVGVIAYARAASTDMPLAECFGIAMLSWWAWREGGKKIHLAAFYALSALGMLAKGPVAPFLAAVVILAYAAAAGELRVVWKTLWVPGIVLFCGIAFPWYAAVQMYNPQFFREFILEHNLARFSRNLYHHTEPFWYYLPVALLALMPWAVFALAALVDAVKRWRGAWKSDAAEAGDANNQFGIFALSWLIVPVIFFSISKSKLPGYILPAIPAGALLLVEYLRNRLGEKRAKVGLRIVVVHALVASAPIVPALLSAYLITQRRLPGGQPMFVTLAVAFVVCSAIALVLARYGLRMVRVVTLIPLVLAVGAVLKLGAQPLDQTLCARPLALEIAAVEAHPLPLAVYHVRRELEYGLTFYRNRLTFNYDWGRVPREEHLLVAPENSLADIARLVPGRRISYLGRYEAQHVDYFWIAAESSLPR